MTDTIVNIVRSTLRKSGLKFGSQDLGKLFDVPIKRGNIQHMIILDKGLFNFGQCWQVLQETKVKLK